MHKYFETLAVRALNGCRTLHLPSYLGLRLFLASHPPKGSSDWGSRLIYRKLDTRDHWRYYRFQGLRKIQKDGNAEYRTFVMGSPTTILAEANLLFHLSREPEFRTHPSAYSYLWPKSDRSGRSYDFYLRAYERRNLEVMKFLRPSRNEVAVVLDIRDFYASVDRQLLLGRVEKRLGNLRKWPNPDQILRFISSLLEASPGGVPVGPEIGHLLGHLALEDVDRRMHAKFGNKYLRYVDDVIIVCDRSEANRAIDLFGKVLEEEGGGLEPNEDKRDIVPSNVWIADVPKPRDPKERPTFHQLLRFMSNRLIDNPKSYEDLRAIFVNNGFSLPFRRIGELARYGRYRAYQAPFRLLRKIVSPSDTGLLKMAVAVREKTLAELRSLRQNDAPTLPMQRRWYVQKYRYRLNSMLYLLRPEAYGGLLELVPDIDEFAENRALLEAFNKEDATDLTRLPGHAVSAFAELWSETKDRYPKVDWQLELSDATIDGLGTLALFRVVDIPPSILNSVSLEAKAFLDFCSGNAMDRHGIMPLSYLDELRALQLGYDKDSMLHFVTSRFTDKEQLVPQGIQLGGLESP